MPQNHSTLMSKNVNYYVTKLDSIKSEKKSLSPHKKIKKRLDFLDAYALYKEGLRLDSSK